MTQQSPDRNTTAPYQGVLMEINLVHATTQPISIEVELALIDKAAYDWAQLAQQATTAEVAEAVSVAYTALSHERTALTLLSTLPLDVGAKQEDLSATIGGYREAIMYVGFAGSEWSGVASELYGHQHRHAAMLDKATQDLCRELVLDALAQRSRLTALMYRLSLLQAHIYERLLYPPSSTKDTEAHDHD